MELDGAGAGGSGGVSDAAESTIVNGVDTANSVMGIYYSVDAGRDVADEYADGWECGGADSGGGGQWAGGECCDGGGVECGAAEVLCGGVRYHGYYTSVDGVTWTRLAGAGQAGTGFDGGGLPSIAGWDGDVRSALSFAGRWRCRR